MPGYDLSPEIVERLIAIQGVMRFAIQHRDGAGVKISLRIQSLDQLVKRLEIGVVSWLLERINDNWMDLARRPSCLSFFFGCRRLSFAGGCCSAFHTF